MSIVKQLQQGHREFSLPATLRLANGDTLRCTHLLRVLPGKRAVMKARWLGPGHEHEQGQGRSVLVKLMLNTASGARNARRELAGHAILNAAKITTPQLLLTERGADESHVLVFEFLHQERRIAELWRDHAERRAQIARDCLRLIARMHAHGCCQNDLYLDNFLLAGERLYAIDFASVSRRANTEYGNWQRQNLALFFVSFAPVWHKFLLNALTKNYAVAAADDKLERAIARAWRRSKSRYLKKCFRECSEFSTRTSWRQVAVWSRAHHCADLISFVQNPEAWMAKGELLKDGTSATVVRVVMNGMNDMDGDEKMVVIKRNNIKNMFHGLRYCLRATRSRVNWRNAHLLKISGIKTPPPIAFVETRWGPFRVRGYYVCAFNGFPSAAEKYQSHVPAAHELAWFEALFANMYLARIYHGDCKASNLLVTDDGVAVIDLDSMKECSARKIRALARKDRRRFLKNWEGKPAQLKLFSEILSKA